MITKVRPEIQIEARADGKEVMLIAAATQFALATGATGGTKNESLERYLERFKKAYQSLKAVVDGSPE